MPLTNNEKEKQAENNKRRDDHMFLFSSTKTTRKKKKSALSLLFPSLLLEGSTTKRTDRPQASCTLANPDSLLCPFPCERNEIYLDAKMPYAYKHDMPYTRIYIHTLSGYLAGYVEYQEYHSTSSGFIQHPSLSLRRESCTGTCQKSRRYV